MLLRPVSDARNSPSICLSLYLTDGVVNGGGADNDVDGDDGNGGDDDGRVAQAQALLCLILGRYSVQVGRLWRVF